MSIDDAEYDVASNAIKAERHYRTYLYVLATLAFFVFVYIAHRMTQIENRISENNTRLIVEAGKLNKQAMDQLRVQSEEILRYTTCLLIVPIEQRSIEVRQDCFSKSDLPGGLEQEDFNITASFLSVPEDAVSSQMNGSTSPNDIAFSPTPQQEFSPPDRSEPAPSPSPSPNPSPNPPPPSPQAPEESEPPLVSIPNPVSFLRELIQL